MTVEPSLANKQLLNNNKTTHLAWTCVRCEWVGEGSSITKGQWLHHGLGRLRIFLFVIIQLYLFVIFLLLALHNRGQAENILCQPHLLFFFVIVMHWFLFVVVMLCFVFLVMNSFNLEFIDRCRIWWVL